MTAHEVNNNNIYNSLDYQNCVNEAVDSDAVSDNEENENKIFEFAKNNFDTKPYEKELLNSIPGKTVSESFNKVIVDGIELELGMKYEEVIAAGFKPVSDDFENEIPGGLAKVGDFVDKSGKVVSLSFVCENDSEKVIEGIVYSIQISLTTESAATMELDGLKLAESGIKDVVDKYGEPQSIHGENYSDNLYLGLNYTSKDFPQEISFLFSLKSGRVFSMAIEGYKAYK